MNDLIDRLAAYQNAVESLANAELELERFTPYVRPFIAEPKELGDISAKIQQSHDINADLKANRDTAKQLLNDCESDLLKEITVPDVWIHIDDLYIGKHLVDYDGLAWELVISKDKPTEPLASVR